MRGNGRSLISSSRNRIIDPLPKRAYGVEDDERGKRRRQMKDLTLFPLFFK